MSQQHNRQSVQLNHHNQATSLVDQAELRWMGVRDLPRVLEIEAASYEYPWSEEDFRQWLRQRNSIGMVAEIDGQVVAFVVYSLEAKWITIRNLAVCPNYRRAGIGRKILAKLEAKLTSDRRRSIFIDVQEINLSAQQFFRGCGWKCRAIVPAAYETPDGTQEDAYQFVRRLVEVRELENQTRKLSDAGFTEKT